MSSSTVDIAIKGMHCAACSSRIERVISKKEGVDSISVSLASHTGKVGLAEGVDRESVVQSVLQGIDALGFTAEVLSSGSGKGGFLSDAASRWEKREEEQKNDLAERKKDLVPAFLFALPLLVLSMGEMAGMPLPAFINPAQNPARFAILQLLLCLPVLWSGRRFYLLGLPALFRRSPTMDTLVALGTGAAFLFSLFNTFALTLPPDTQAALGIVHQAGANAHAGQGILTMLFGMGHSPFGVDLYYESAAVVIALVSLGKYFEVRSGMRTSEALKGLLDLAPETAILLSGLEDAGQHDILPLELGKALETAKEVPLQEVHVGNILLVRPGGRIPVDGIAVHGESHVDESMLTGESMPVGKKRGDSLAAGTMNADGLLVMQAKGIGEETILARIVRLVQDAQGSKAPIASLADKVSLYFVPAVMGIAVLAGLGWWLYGGSVAFGLRSFVSVLVIACPCAMGLATPMAIMVGTGRGAQLGVLFKNGQALEAVAKLDTLVFDKTGTLTKGKPAVVHIEQLPLPEELLRSGDLAFLRTVFPDSGNGPEAEPGVLPAQEHTLTSQRVLQLAASLEAVSEHPLAKAVILKAKEVQVPLLPVSQFVTHQGLGVSGLLDVDGKFISVGVGNLAFGEGLIEGQSPEKSWKNGKFFEAAVMPVMKKFAEQGKTPVLLYINAYPVAILVIADPLREETPQIIRSLKERNIASVMLTGDSQITAEAIASEAGIVDVVAGVLPDGKEKTITGLQAQSQRVGMVGDGINDAPALARADVGIAMGSGIDVAIETGDVVLMQQGLSSLIRAIDLSRATMRNIKENLFWAFAFNIIGIPFAAGVFHLFGGPVLSPMLAGTAMAMSSVCVVTNSLRLRFFRADSL